MIWIKPIEQDDIELIRQWRNSNQQSFFDQKEISKEQQKDWFESYRNDFGNRLFIALFDKIPFGCIGVKLCREIGHNHWELYNVICADEHKGNKLMKQALKQVVATIYGMYALKYPVRAKVLKDNRAVKWYEDNKFKVIEIEDDFYLMEYVGKRLS